MLKNIAIISLLALALIFSACGETSTTKEKEADNCYVLKHKVMYINLVNYLF
ncbi:MAG: hypothetical protein AAFR87_31015 [Bacteroidota bacterium]